MPLRANQRVSATGHCGAARPIRAWLFGPSPLRDGCRKCPLPPSQNPLQQQPTRWTDSPAGQCGPDRAPHCRCCSSFLPDLASTRGRTWRCEYHSTAKPGPRGALLNRWHRLAPPSRCRAQHIPPAHHHRRPLGRAKHLQAVGFGICGHGMLRRAAGRPFRTCARHPASLQCRTILYSQVLYKK